MLDVGETEEVTEFGVETGVSGDGHVLAGMGVEVDVLAGRFDGGCGLWLVGGDGSRTREGYEGGEEQDREARSKRHADEETRPGVEWVGGVSALIMIVGGEGGKALSLPGRARWRQF